MKLEDKFFKTFFYPFLIAITISIIMVAIVLSRYSNNYLDKRSAKDIYEMEKKYASININSLNILLTNTLLKVQVGLLEQLTFYQNIASKITDRSKSTIGKDVYNVVEVQTKEPERKEYASIWFVDRDKLNNSDIDPLSDLYQQISVFSQLTQSLYSVYNSMNETLLSMYFLFEDTNLFIAYPYTYFYDYETNPSWCTDENGNIINYYRIRCRNFYNDIMKAKEEIFDMNINDQPDRKIYITTPYHQLGSNSDEIIFTLCIQFNDNISHKNSYICGDINGDKLFNSFDNFNEKLIGYITIVSIGFNNAFYFPQMSTNGYGKTTSEYIFRWDKDYYLEEKLDFVNIIQKNITSNYFKLIDKEKIKTNPISIFNEIYIDNERGENQYFYFNKEKYNYCIFPIILETLNIINKTMHFEHVLSIVYLFNKKLFYQQILEYQNNSSSKIILQLVLFIFFGMILLYLIVLSFKLLAKFIVIPIKNVQYMLQGINIGGEYRLEFLNNLKKKQEDNLDKLNKINHQLKQRNSEKNKNKFFDINGDYKEKDINKLISKSTIKNIDIDKNKDKYNNKDLDENKNSIKEKKTVKNVFANINTKTIQEDEKLLNTTSDANEDTNDMNLDYNGELINPKINYDKQYDIDGDILEQELNFYDFDEELLQYRPIEIDRLVQSLLNLKSALILISSDHDVENIIDYSNSQYIFSNFKNK